MFKNIIVFNIVMFYFNALMNEKSIGTFYFWVCSKFENVKNDPLYYYTNYQCIVIKNNISNY